jgi:hypothetical protein
LAKESNGLVMLLTSEVEGEVLERTIRFVDVAAGNESFNEPLEEVVAGFDDLLVVDRLQLHFESDSGTAEFGFTATVLWYLLPTAQELSELIDDLPYEIKLRLLSLTVRS